MIIFNLLHYIAGVTGSFNKNIQNPRLSSSSTLEFKDGSGSVCLPTNTSDAPCNMFYKFAEMHN